MAALIAARDTKRKLSAHDMTLDFPVGAAVTIYQGSLVMLDGGYAKPGATAVGKIAVGRALATVDNSAGGAGALTGEIEKGIFKWGNSGSSITQANIGSDVYIVDDNSVHATDGGGTRSRAGIAVSFDSTGVYVQTGLGL